MGCQVNKNEKIITPPSPFLNKTTYINNPGYCAKHIKINTNSEIPMFSCPINHIRAIYKYCQNIPHQSSVLLSCLNIQTLPSCLSKLADGPDNTIYRNVVCYLYRQSC